MKVDTRSLAETGAALRLLAGELRDAEVLVRDAGPDLGHRGLAERLQDMQSSWDDRREEARDGIEGLAEAARVAAESFEDIEASLVAALEDR